MTPRVAFAVPRYARRNYGKLKRRVFRLNRKWLYTEKNMDGAAALHFDDRDFEPVTLPHTNVVRPWRRFDDKSYEFVSIYRRHMRFPSFLDRGELRSLGQPTVLANGKRIPGLKLDHPRQLAVMSSLVRFSHVAAGDTFTTSELQAGVAEALDVPVEKCPLGSVRYELSKLRAKGLVEKLSHSRRYPFLPNGYRICLVFL